MGAHGAGRLGKWWRACEAAKVKLMVGHKRRLRPPGARLIELREILGPVYAIQQLPLLGFPLLTNYQGCGRAKAEGGGRCIWQECTTLIYARALWRLWKP